MQGVCKRVYTIFLCNPAGPLCPIVETFDFRFVVGAGLEQWYRARFLHLLKLVAKGEGQGQYAQEKICPSLKIFEYYCLNTF